MKNNVCTDEVPANNIETMRQASWLFIAYRFLTRLYFHLPFLVLIILIARGYSYLEAGLFLSAFSLAAFIGAPSLKQALKGRSLKHVIVMAEAIKAASLLLLILADNAYLMVIAQYLAGLGYMLSMGPDSQSLRNRVDQSVYLITERKAHSAIFISLALAAICGGFIAQIDLNYTLYATLVASVGTVIIGAKLGYGRYAIGEKQQTRTRHNQDKRLLIIILSYGFSRGYLLAIFTAFLPIILFIEGAISLVEFGSVIGAYSMISMLSSRLSKTVLAKMGPRFCLLAIFIVMLLISVLISASGYVPKFFILIIPPIMGLVLGFIRPATLQLLANVNGEEETQLAMSRADQLVALISAIFILPVYVLIHIAGSQIAMIVLALMGALISIACLIALLAISHDNL